jgi:hypothetical protein
MNELREFVLRRIQHATKRIDQITKQQGENASQTHTYHGGQTLGYWQGKLSAYELIMDEIDGI